MNIVLGVISYALIGFLVACHVQAGDSVQRSAALLGLFFLFWPFCLLLLGIIFLLVQIEKIDFRKVAEKVTGIKPQ